MEGLTNNLFLFFLLLLFVKSFFISTTAVVGRSMEPTLIEGDRLVFVPYSPGYGNLRQGDIVVVEYSKTRFYIKRVLGLPGDLLSIEDDQLYINGEKIPLPEDIFLQPYGQLSFSQLELGPDQVYLLGDNYKRSRDSRSFGPVDIRGVKGRVLFRVLPLNRWALLVKSKKPWED